MFQILNFVSIYFALVGIFTYVVFEHGHKIFFNITFLANSYTDIECYTYFFNTDEEMGHAAA
jgi:hypothetical protein